MASAAKRVWATATVCFALWGCLSPEPDLGDPVSPPFDVELIVVDEDGIAVQWARVEADSVYATSAEGRVRIPDRRAPVFGVVSADGFLPEPFLAGRESVHKPVHIRLHRKKPGRFAVHFAGDAMLGRRYETPPSGAPLLNPARLAESAEQVVDAIAAPFAAADLSVLNLETVVSNAPWSEAYPAKRFVLRTRPDALAALLSLGVDVAVLANNHTRDFLDQGVIDTVQAVEANGMLPVGAGADEDAADEPVVVSLPDATVGVAAWTTLTGSVVNNQYPDANAQPPPNLPDKERWQYDERTWEFTHAEWKVPEQPRRIGAAWRLFDAAEPGLSREARTEAWTSLTEVYPELQDWVARRGHGGPALWSSVRGKQVIETLRPQVDVLVVQFHSGFQFQHAPSSYVRRITREAIDAGADIVIAHHPHVLQGLEWYRGKLIVYSLGNFLFDQDFLATFPSAFVRTVWEAGQLLEARVFPVEIAGYQPYGVSGASAAWTSAQIAERSWTGAQTDRSSEGEIVAYPADEDGQTKLPHLAFDRGSITVSGPPLPQLQLQSELVGGASLALDQTSLVDPAGVGPGVWLGRDLFPWGHFENLLANSAAERAAHWNLDSSDERIVAGDAAGGHRFLRMFRSVTNLSSLSTRPIARIPLDAHRRHEDASDASPADGEASYSVRFMARRTGKGNSRSAVRIDLYSFDDTVAVRDPESTDLGRHELPFEVGPEWTLVELALPARWFEGSPAPNMLMPYLVLEAPSTWESQLDIDDFSVIEWRRAGDLPVVPIAVDFVRSP